MVSRIVPKMRTVHADRGPYADRGLIMRTVRTVDGVDPRYYELGVFIELVHTLRKPSHVGHVHLGLPAITGVNTFHLSPSDREFPRIHVIFS